MGKRFGIFLAIGLAIVVLYNLDAFEYLHPTVLREILLDLGPWWGPALFVAAFAFGQLLGAPGTPFLLAAVLTWPPAMAFLVLWVGAVFAGVPSFLVTRYVAHEWVSARLPARFRAYDARLAERGITSVIFVRFLLFTSPLAGPVLAVSRVGFLQFVVGSAIGMAPGVLMWALVGPRMATWFFDLPPLAWAGIAGVCVACTLAVLAYRRRRNVLVPQPAPADGG